MKNLFLILAGLLFITSVTNAQYKINKTQYDYHTYKHQVGDPYNPSVAGVSSFLIPGIGQMTSGEFIRGAVFLGGYASCYVIFAVGFNELWSGSVYKLGSTMFLSGLAGILIVNIWSIIDAVHVAKVNDLAFRNNNKTSFNIQVQPYINTTCYTKAGSIPAGITLIVAF
jgi:hypothetical protein